MKTRGAPAPPTLRATDPSCNAGRALPRRPPAVVRPQSEPGRPFAYDPLARARRGPGLRAARGAQGRETFDRGMGWPGRYHTPRPGRIRPRYETAAAGGGDTRRVAAQVAACGPPGPWEGYRHPRQGAGRRGARTGPPACRRGVGRPRARGLAGANWHQSLSDLRAPACAGAGRGCVRQHGENEARPPARSARRENRRRPRAPALWTCHPSARRRTNPTRCVCPVCMVTYRHGR